MVQFHSLWNGWRLMLMAAISASETTMPRVVRAHAGAFGDASEEWEGAPMTGLPGSNR
jgi:hypothetical protein